MFRRTRVGVLAVIGVLSAPVVVAGMAWACGPSGYGTPEAPPAPPLSSGQPTAPSTAPAAVPAPSAAPQASAPAAGVNQGSATTRGIRSSGSQSPRTPARQAPTVGNTAPSSPGQAGSPGQADINARVNGATAGVTSQRGQRVFTSSTAPRASQPSRAKSKADSPAKAKSTTAPAVSQRSATGDLWGAVSGSGANPSLASAAGGNDGGLSGGLVAAIAILGLALTGIVGGALATAGQRRRAAAGAAKRR